MLKKGHEIMQVSIRQEISKNTIHQFIINNFILALKECNVLHVLMYSVTNSTQWDPYE